MTRVFLLIFLLFAFLIGACTSTNPASQTTGTITNSTTITTEPVVPTNTPTPGLDTPNPSPEPATETPVPPTATITPTPTVEILPSGPDAYPEGYNPLTGLPVDDPGLLERRPMAVKVQLYPRGGRPPWGVSQADIVYDYYQNDGLTRLNAVFYGSEVEQIGPIRSARIFDEHVMRMYKAIFAFGGADWRVYNRIYDADLRDLMVVEGAYNCPPMCRIDPNAANYLVTNTEDLSQHITDQGIENGRQDLGGMSFDPQTPAGGAPGEQVEVHWSFSAYTRWVYDRESEQYLREQDTTEASSREAEQFEDFTDRNSGEQIAADNLVVIPLNHVDLYPQNKFEVMDIQLPVGESGTAYAFRDGQVYEVMWNRPEPDSVLYLTYEDGSEFPFKPGNTWFEVVGMGSKISQPQHAVWRFEFRY